MIMQAEENFGGKVIRLLPQEKEGRYQFSGKFVATRSAIEKFGEVVIPF